MGTNEKEVTEAKKAAKMAKKHAKNQAQAKKMMREEEKRKLLKGLSVEAGMMGPPTTTQVARKSGKEKWTEAIEAPKKEGRSKDDGQPPMVKKPHPRIDLSPNLANVSAFVEGMEEDAALASVL